MPGVLKVVQRQFHPFRVQAAEVRKGVQRRGEPPQREDLQYPSRLALHFSEATDHQLSRPRRRGDVDQAACASQERAPRLGWHRPDRFQVRHDQRRIPTGDPREFESEARRRGRLGVLVAHEVVDVDARPWPQVRRNSQALGRKIRAE